jgi:hypothetical protein
MALVSRLFRTIKKIENMFIKSERFHLPSKKVFQSGSMALEIILVDATEQPVERPQKNSGISTAAKRNVMPRMRMIITDIKTGRILSASFCAGRKHDFQLFKESELPPHVLLLADAGYQGVVGIHSNSLTPIKKIKPHLLDKEQKASNRALSQKRTVIEHISCKLKVFRILRERYRNRRKTFRSSFQFDRSRL